MFFNLDFACRKFFVRFTFAKVFSPSPVKLESRAPVAVRKCRSGWIRWPQSAVSGIGVQVIPAKPLYIAFLISELSANSVTNNTVIFSMITYSSSQGARIQERNLLLLFTQRTLFYQLSWLYESLIFSNRSLAIGFFSFRQLCMLVRMFICKVDMSVFKPFLLWL